MTHKGERLLTVSQAARRLRVHPQTLRAWADKGLIPVIKLPSGYRRFDPAALDEVARQMGLDESGPATGERESAGAGDQASETLGAGSTGAEDDSV